MAEFCYCDVTASPINIIDSVLYTYTFIQNIPELEHCVRRQQETLLELRGNNKNERYYDDVL